MTQLQPRQFKGENENIQQYSANQQPMNGPKKYDPENHHIQEFKKVDAPDHH